MNNKKMKSFLRPKQTSLICSCLFLVFAAIVAIASSDDSRFILSGFAVVIFAVFGLPTIIRNHRLKTYFKELSQKGILTQMMEDFHTASPLFKGQLYLGKYWMFGKRSGKAIAYSDIIRIYQYIHKTNLVEDSRMLRIELPDTKSFDICRMPLRGKGDDDLQKAFDLIREKNPNTTLGYGK